MVKLGHRQMIHFTAIRILDLDGNPVHTPEAHEGGKGHACGESLATSENFCSHWTDEEESDQAPVEDSKM